jgi:hypothetical protein
MSEPDEPRPSIAASMANWRTYRAPFYVKMQLAARNNWLKLIRRDSCCGNDGEPGC